MPSQIRLSVIRATHCQYAFATYPDEWRFSLNAYWLNSLDAKWRFSLDYEWRFSPDPNSVDTGEFPLWVALDELVVVADLCGQRMHHPVAFHRYTSVGGDLLSGRQDRPRDLDFLYSFHGFPVSYITLKGVHSKLILACSRD